MRIVHIIALVSAAICLLCGCSETPPQAPKMSESAQKFYSQLFDVAFNGTEDTLLLAELQTWIGTPYCGGMAKKGVGTDCSGFVQSVYRKIYGVNLSRTAEEIAQQITVKNKRDLSCGDLVFFRDWIGNIAHVGIYLGDGKFIHAATGNSVGICVDMLSNKHYTKRYWAGGGVKTK